MTTAESIQAMADRIVRDFHPVRLVLFGSHARGDARPESDVDLLVVLPQVSDKRRAAVEIRRVLADFPVCKDIIVTTPEEIARHRRWRDAADVHETRGLPSTTGRDTHRRPRPRPA